MFTNLSLQQNPPFSVPARFFITAPLFGIGAALVFLFYGSGMLVSRWSPGMLAATHALVLGFFATVMLGALQQILPVVVGVSIRHPKRVAGIVHLLWVTGITLLIGAFLWPANNLFYIAVIVLGSAIVIFVGTILMSLQRAPTHSEATPGIKLAVSSLFITLVLGVVLIFGHTGVIPLFRPGLTNLHMSWGLIGWIAMLVMSIAWQVVPMFQITPPYPKWLRKKAASFFLILLLAKSLISFVSDSPVLSLLDLTVDILIAAGLLVFALSTLHLQRQTRRKVYDNHRYFWRLSMINLIIVVILWALAEISGNPLFGLLAGVLFLMGFAMSVVTGMLLKIIAFLVWLHLQKVREEAGKSLRHIIKVPKMKEVISSRSSNSLIVILMFAQAAMLMALLSPQHFSIAAALCWLVFFCTLLGILGYAMFRYQRFVKKAFLV